MLVRFLVYSIKDNQPKNSGHIAPKIMLFYVFGVSQCKRKCVSWFWNVGFGVTLVKFWKITEG